MRRIFALAFLAFAAPVQAQVSALFPLDHFWTQPFDVPLAASPAADDRRVYLPLSTGQLIAMDPRTSEVSWSVELAADGAPLVAEKRLFVAAGDAIHALDAEAGAVAWRLPGGALAAPLVYRAGWLIVARADGVVQGVRASDGTVVWARDLGSAMAGAPALDGDLLAAALADGRIVALDLTTGALRWARTLGAPAGAITLSGDRIFAGTDDGYFWSLETSDGDADWRYGLGSRLVGAATADADRVYAVARDNVVRGFSRRSGNIRWTHPLPTRPVSGPHLVEGLLMITSGLVGNPGLTYLNAATGAPAGATPRMPDVEETRRTQFPVQIGWGAAPIAVIASATTDDGWQVHAFRQTFFIAATGPVVWGKRYEVRQRLEISTGRVVWGEAIKLRPPQGPTIP